MVVHALSENWSPSTPLRGNREINREMDDLSPIFLSSRTTNAE
jgi:hypothetical protein